MTTKTKFRRARALLRTIACSIQLAGALHAQQLLLVRSNDRLYPVVNTKDGTAIALLDNKPSAVKGGEFALEPAPAFQPGFVKIEHWEAIHAATRSIGSTALRNHDLVFRGDFTASRALKDCYLVAEMKFTGEPTGLVLCSLPDLPADRSVPLDVRFKFNRAFEGGQYQLHFFSGAGEFLHSQMSPDFIQKQREQTDRYILSKSPDRRAGPSAVVTPQYPKEFSGQALEGEALIFCRIATTGEIIESSVRNATREEFGREALAAVRQWKFAAAIKDHAYVETNLLIPIGFKPPVSATAKKN